ncbi:ATP-binding cassette domain-containing protein [Saccharospirillum alexandrii]|uniref:ATP-binding cassette domain-containing protein n=1 Tax=Saccharospirillum alexandrii TaxID=2448477 RepID=UPI000FDAED66|nr:ATP-binding cassette domain-containing protein [Saccharospirillum alexandrii]
MTLPPAFHVQNLTVGYDQRIIIDRLTLSLGQGRLTALVGPNGCGKSTLLKSLAHLLTPQHGQVVLQDGTTLNGLSTKAIARRIALLPQTPLVPEGIRVFDLVAYGRSPHLNAFGQLREHDRERVRQAMTRMDVTGLAARPVAQLSGGQRQRVWMAMILAQDTGIVLLDEPTTYLDLAHQYDLLELVRELIGEGRTVITVLHDLNQACRFADELVVMKEGQIMAQGKPEAVISEPLLAEVFGLDARIVPDPESGTPLCVPRVKRPASARPNPAGEGVELRAASCALTARS